MKHVSSYKAQFRPVGSNCVNLEDTVDIFQMAVAFFIDVCNKEWPDIALLLGTDRNNYIEKLTHRTKSRPDTKYDFGKVFYKFPAYLRRSAIQKALGYYSSYVSNLANWIRQHNEWVEAKKAGKKAAQAPGKKPTLNFIHKVMPTFYGSNMYQMDRDGETVRIKVFHQNDWVWMEVKLRKQDIKYFAGHCADAKRRVPTLKRAGKRWFLVFPFEREIKLQKKKSIFDQLICCVDLGINHHAVCSIMRADGSVLARRFINFAEDKDRLNTLLKRMNKIKRSGIRKTPILWKHAKDKNTEISRKTMNAIIEFALKHKVDVIVFEHLGDLKGKKRGRNKQKLHMWRKIEIQKIVTHKAHRFGMRISRVNAWNTSRLAFDGSGEVTRDDKNYSLCTFATGKRYHADLNAPYNIGARYFVREFLREESLLATVGLSADAKAHSYDTGITRTLCTLKRLYADIVEATQ